MPGLLIALCPLYKVYDTLYSIDLSGDNQVIEVGGEFKPIRLKTGRGCKVKFVYIGDTTLFRISIPDSVGIVIFNPPKPESPGNPRVLAITEDSHITISLTVLKNRFWIFLTLEFLAGFLLFIFGLNRGSSGIMRAVGGWTRNALNNLSNKPFLAIFGGIIGAMGFQSSTAVTVMVVSLTDLGILSPQSAMAMNAGAGIGTTVTVGILSLGFTYIAVVLMAAGYILEKSIKGYEHYGRAMFGFGMAFFGIWYMGSVFSKFSDIHAFTEIVKSISENTTLILVFSAIFTALVHSSALTVGIALSMAFAGILDFKSALSIVLGANIGTAFTAVLASSSLSNIARRVAIINLVGRAILSSLLLTLVGVSDKFPIWTGDITKDIALSHIYYNIAFAALMIPVIYLKPLWVIKPSKSSPNTLLFLEDPSLIVAYMEKLITDGLNVSITMFQKIPQIVRSRSPLEIEEFAKLDDEIDNLEDRINALMARALSYDLSERTTNRVVAMAYIMEEIEGAGDIMSKSISRLVEKMYKEGINLSIEEYKGLEVIHKEVLKTFADAMVVLTDWNIHGAEALYKRRDVVKYLLDDLRRKYYSESLSTGKFQSGEVYLDLLSDMERVNFHISSIGNAISESLKDNQ